MNDKPLWDVGETVKKREQERTVGIKYCPLQKSKYGNEAFCTGAKCELWSDVGGACAFVVIAAGLYGE